LRSHFEAEEREGKGEGREENRKKERDGREGNEKPLEINF